MTVVEQMLQRYALNTHGCSCVAHCRTFVNHQGVE
jgi:hypothetical protein